MNFGLWVVLIYSFVSLIISLFVHGRAMITKEQSSVRIAHFIMFTNAGLILACIVMLLYWGR